MNISNGRVKTIWSIEESINKKYVFELEQVHRPAALITRGMKKLFYMKGLKELDF